VSSNVKGIATIELRSDKFVQSADKAKNAVKKLGDEGKTALNKVGTAADAQKQKFSSMGDAGKRSFDKIGSSADQTKQKMSSLGVTGQQALGKIGTSADQTKQKLSSAGTAGATSMANLGAAGSRAGGQVAVGMNQATNSVRQLNLATQTATASSGVMILGIAALGTSIGTTFTGMSNLNKAELSLNKAHQKVEKSTVGLARANDLLSSTQLAVRRFTLSVAKMEEQGLQATDTYTIAKANLALQNQKLITATDDYAVKLKDIKIAEDDALQVADDLQDTYINMTISIANTGLMMLFLTKTMLPGLNRAVIGSKLHLLAMNSTFTRLIFSMKKFRLGMAGASVGIRTLGISVRSFMFALGPLGIAMIAIGVAFEIWETNAFGVQEAVVELWQWLKKFIPILTAVETLVQSVFPKAEDGLEDVATAATGATAELTDLKDISNELGVDLQQGLITDLDLLEQGFVNVGSAAGTAGAELDAFKKKRENLSRTVSAETSESFVDTLFGRNGIFSQTGRQLAGFRSTFVTQNEGTIRQGLRPISSRILTNLPTPQGGQALNAIRTFQARSFNNFASGGPQFGGAGVTDQQRLGLNLAIQRRAQQKTFRNSDEGQRISALGSIVRTVLGTGFQRRALSSGQSRRLRTSGVGRVSAEEREVVFLAARFGLIHPDEVTNSTELLALARARVKLLNIELAKVGTSAEQILEEAEAGGVDVNFRLGVGAAPMTRRTGASSASRLRSGAATQSAIRTQLATRINFALELPLRQEAERLQAEADAALAEIQRAQAAIDLANKQAFDERAMLEANLV